MTTDTRNDHALESREDLALVLLGGYCHDVGSPLAALVSNLGVARDIVTSLPDASSAALVELREVLDDLEASTTRLTEHAADLRVFAGLPAGDGTVDEIARVALRLARAHLSRRADVELALDPKLRADLSSGLLARTLGEVLVALTRELPGVGPRAHTVRVSTEPSGLVLRMSPPPGTDVTDGLALATSRLEEGQVGLLRTDEHLEVRIALRWA